MLRTTLAGITQHASRYVTTALAILLGVMFIVGTMVFADTLQGSYEKTVMGSAHRVDAVAVVQSLPGQDGMWEEPVPFTDEQLDQIRALPQVEKADGVRQSPALLLDDAGRAYGTFPPVAMTVEEVTRFTASEGSLPSGDQEIALATSISEQTGFEIGDTVTLLDRDHAEREFTVTGLLDLGLEPGLSYRGAFVLAPDAFADVTGDDGYHEIDVLAASGVSEEEAASAVEVVLGSEGADVTTATVFGEQQAASVGTNADTIRSGLLLFASVAVFVAGIVIYNTFAILVAQRQRELALLRCVGARRGQVFRSVLAESFLLGLVASVLGVVVGIGVGMLGMRYGGALFTTDVNTSLVLSPTAVLTGLLVGVVMTVVSASVPAVRATRVAPLAALRTSATAAGLEKGTGTLRVVVGIVLFAIAAGLVAMALRGEPEPSKMWVVGGAAMVAFVGVVVLGPLLVRGIVRVVGVPLRRVSVSSMLAVDNSTRSPRRAATAMIALTVGATLITGYSVVSDSMQQTVNHELDVQFPVDYEIRPMMNLDDLEGNDQSEDAASETVGGTDLTTVPESVRSDLAARSEVEQVFAQRTEHVETDNEEIADFDGTLPVSTFVDATLGEEIQVEVTKGDLDDFGPGSVIVSATWEESVGVGDTIALGASGHEFEVVALVENSPVFYGFAMVPEDYEQVVPESTGDSTVMVRGSDSATPAELREAVHSTTEAHPTLSITSMSEMRQEFDQMLEVAFYAIAAMLGLAVVIAVFGISNTMALSVLERTRESALLRALGLKGSQLRRMLGVEAILLCLIGAGTGVVLGALFGWAAMASVLPQVILGFPVGQVAVFLAIAVLAGVVASLLPARRAARTSITGALAGD
ncbi:MAG TPA: ABC transporter permease [Candidatus Nocardiopsis merdipullorum]|nr:ABC transporter permease [Candidatus Nocardiopsis merdipullorum]